MDYKYDMLYIRNWGDKGEYKEFPYTINGVNTLPEYDESLNDVDVDAYTNLKGKTIRNRVRQGVVSLDFSVPSMSGKEYHDFIFSTKNVWLDCYFFNENEWKFTSKKMYRSATVKAHKYYIDPVDPYENIYTDVEFSFVEE